MGEQNHLDQKFGVSAEVKEMLEGAGLGIGAIVTDADVKDTMDAFVYKQNPERFDDEKRIQRIRSGQLMDVWLQVNKPKKDSIGKSKAGTDEIEEQ